MKKALCALLCLLLALPATVLAEDTATLDVAALMARQVSANSTFRVQVTAEVSEQAPSFDQEGLWTLLEAILPGLSLEGSYVMSRAGETLGNSQASLYLRREGETLTALHLNGRGDTWQLWGDALEDTVVTLPRDMSLLLKNNYLTLPEWGGTAVRGLGVILDRMDPAQPGQWPSPLRALLALGTESDPAWRENMELVLRPYTAQVSAWMQEHMDIQLEKGEDGVPRMTSELRADSAALKEEILALLDMFWADRPLQSLLKPYLTDAETEAYLEPGMRRLFESVLSDMRLAGEMTLSRAFTAAGELDRQTLTLPLADGTVCTLTEEGGVRGLTLEKEKTVLTFTLENDAEESWQGAFRYETEEQTLSGKYRLFASFPPMMLDASDDVRARNQTGNVTLLITPDEGMPFAAQSLTAEITAYAGAQDTQAAHWNAILEWRETGTGAFARAEIKTRTGAAIQQQEPAGEALDLTQAGEDLRKAVGQQVLAHWLRLLLRQDAVDSAL